MKPKLLLCLALVLSGALTGGKIESIGKAQSTVTNLNGDARPETNMPVINPDVLRNCDTSPGTAFELKIYIVQQNDNLARISKRFGTTVAALDLYNPKMAGRHAAGYHPEFKPEIGEQLLVYVDKTSFPPNTAIEPRVATQPEH
jgi:LysM repeat protein